MEKLFTIESRLIDSSSTAEWWEISCYVPQPLGVATDDCAMLNADINYFEYRVVAA